MPFFCVFGFRPDTGKTPSQPRMKTILKDRQNKQVSINNRMKRLSKVIVTPLKISRSQASCFSTLPLCQCGKALCICEPAKKATRVRNLVNSTKYSTDKIDPIEKILKNNREWVAQVTKDDPNYLNHAGAVHKPQYLYFGCSDARVPANLILGLG